MTRRTKLILVPAALILLPAILVAAAWLNTVVVLELAKLEGIYSTPEDGMRVRVTESWVDIEKVEIVRSGPNAFDGSYPHVWFVGANVWADRRADGKPVSPRGYGSAGSFFLHVQDGWVHVPEGRFPDVIGFFMELFDYWG